MLHRYRLIVHLVVIITVSVAFVVHPRSVDAQGGCTTYDFASNGSSGWFVYSPASVLIQGEGFKSSLHNGQYVVNVAFQSSFSELSSTEITFDRGVTGRIEIFTWQGGSGTLIKEDQITNGAVAIYNFSPAASLLPEINYIITGDDLFYLRSIEICLSGPTPTPTPTITTTPTQTSTPTREGIFSTPPPTPTATPGPTPGLGTSTSVPSPAPENFPQPNFPIPTTIPTLSAPGVPPPIQMTLPPPPSVVAFPTLSLPEVLTISPLHITPTNAISLVVISTTLPVSFTASLTGGEISSDTQGFLTPATGLMGELISYTTYLSGQITALSSTHTITVLAAPDWYAPTLPREMANVGWTFEQYADGIDSGERFSLASWGGLFGYMISLPIRLVKSLWSLAVYLGPVGLFLSWLLIMLGLVTIIEALRFLYHTVIALIDIVIKILDLIGQWFPGT